MLERNVIHNVECLQGMRAIEDKAIDLVLCDLPYGTTQNKWDSVIPLPELWRQYERIIKPNGAIVLTAMQPFTSLLVASNLRRFKYEWIWRKPLGTGFLNAKKQPLRNHESALVFYAKQPTYNPQFTQGKPYTQTKRNHTPNYGKIKLTTSESNGKRYPLSVQNFNYDRKKLHPTQKPIALFEYLVRTYTNPGELVLDNCMGSGTTAVACRNTGRDFIGFEMSKEYCEAANARQRALLK